MTRLRIVRADELAPGAARIVISLPTGTLRGRVAHAELAGDLVRLVFVSGATVSLMRRSMVGLITPDSRRRRPAA